MADVVKALLAAPVNAVLLVAGLAFLAVAVFRRITDKLDSGPKGRLFAGLLGIVLVGLSLYLSATASPTREIIFGDAAMQPDAAATQASAAYPVGLPAGQVVKAEDRTYTILRIELDRYEVDRLSLTFTIRMVNHTSYPANFWNASFRLLADDVPVAPIGDLNELVDADAAKDGVVRFAIPAGTKKAALQVDTFGPDAPALPIALPGRS